MTHSHTGNEGSITGVSKKASHTHEIGEGKIPPKIGEGKIPPKKSIISSILASIIGYWWVFLFVFIGISALVSLVSTYPIAINPTDSPIVFEIDRVPYTIPANSPLTIPLSHGDHHISLGGKDMGTFTFGWFDADSIINPTLSEYVVVEILYGDLKYESKLTNATITLSGSAYTGPYRVIQKSLYVKKTWDYGAYEESPATVSTKSNYEIKKELFTLDTFTQSYASDEEIMSATGSVESASGDSEK